MKISPKSLLFILMALSLASQAWANPRINRVHGKEEALQKSKEVGNQISNKTLDEKQTKAIQLINAVGILANGRLGIESEIEKEEAEYAYNGFIARFQGIREDRDALERKEIMADNRTLENYSQRLDDLISELQNFINR